MDPGSFLRLRPYEYFCTIYLDPLVLVPFPVPVPVPFPCSVNKPLVKSMPLLERLLANSICYSYENQEIFLRCELVSRFDSLTQKTLWVSWFRQVCRRTGVRRRRAVTRGERSSSRHHSPSALSTQPEKRNDKTLNVIANSINMWVLSIRLSVDTLWKQSPPAWTQ